MRVSLFLTAAAAILVGGGAATAQTTGFMPKAAGRWVVDLRSTDVSPQGESPVSTASGADAGRMHVTASVAPGLGVSYFITDHLAVEASLGASRHAFHVRCGCSDVKVYRTWALPPAIALQYHFAPRERFSPYVGAGVYGTFFYDRRDQNGYQVRLKNGAGGLVQAGADYAIAGPWTVKVDVMKVFFRTDATIDGGALKSSVGLDPLVASIGFGRRF